MFMITYDKIGVLNEDVIAEGYKLFNLNDDVSIIKNMSGNYKYPYYTLTYEVDCDSVINPTIDLYKCKQKYSQPYEFINVFLSSRLLLTY